MIHSTDAERWRAKLSQIQAAALADEEVQALWEDRDKWRPERDQEARQLVANLVATRDFAAFKAGTDAWSRRPGPYTAFGGFGQVWLNQVANNLPDDPAEVDVLVRAFTTPSSTDEVRERFEAVERVTRDLASKGRPAVGMIPYVLSMFWATDDTEEHWPILWKSAAEGMFGLGWVSSWSNADRYFAAVDASRTFFPGEPHAFERLMWFLMERQRFVGLNPTLPDMCVEAGELMTTFVQGEGYADDESSARAASLAAQLKGELHLAGLGLLDEVNNATGLDLETAQLQLRISFDKSAAFRADAYATWSLPGGMSAPGYRLWATRSGVALGVYGGWGGGSQHGYAQTRDIVSAHLPDGYQFFEIRPHRSGDRLVPTTADVDGEVFAGTWWPWEDVPRGGRLRDDVLVHVERLTPVLKALSAETSSGGTGGGPQEVDDDLRVLVQRFKSERPYPNEKDEWQEEQRTIFAEALSAENLALFDLDLFRRLINGPRYGGPGPQSVLNASLSAMDSLQLDAFASNLREILWGQGDVGERIDRGLDWNDLGTKGLGESVLLKMFAIVDSRRFLPAFPLTGQNGKIAMLRRLALPEPDSTLSRGEQHVRANDTLRESLDPLLPGDSWGQAQFGYWLLSQADAAPLDETDRIAKAATELLVPEPFLRELEELLQEKGQLIFYGPPGTGKTYLADKFAAALQPDSERRMIVQFHPSMSYEDFFEGYRPRLDERGQLSYELRPGPLALMAAKAEAAPGAPHVLIIDEINRANLPRVFGELLFLLEYRNKSVRTAYRPDEPFELPKNLFFIGTMNTADRSIAMVDAALRRRFHFVPFMPHEGAMKSLLADWLKKRGEPAWVAPLVDKVNEQLRILLKGPHLQVGHSHFMVTTASEGAIALTTERLSRIWQYDVYPSIEDQLYGRPDQLEQFTWAKVYAQHGPSSSAGVAAQAERDVAPSGESDDPPQ